MATLVAGGPIRGSWWAHPKSHQIFAQASALGRDPDVIVVPLVAGKVTFVHRRLWPALLAVALERDRWQMTGLSPSARALLKRVAGRTGVRATGDRVREIERRLLAKVHEVHTETGGHAKVLDDWRSWARKAGVAPMADARRARRELEAAVRALSATPLRRALPWPAAEGRASP